MNRGLLVVSGLALTGLVTGCFSTSPAERREAYQKEFTRLASLPVAEEVQSPDPEIAACAKLSCDLFNVVRPLMKAYFDQVESCRAYTAFMNDVRGHVKEDNMDEKTACQTVMDEVMKGDAARPENEKVWPEIVKGINAAKVLNPANQLANVAALIVRNSDIVKRVQKFKDSDAFKKGDFQTKLARGEECKAILDQAEDTGKCLYYLQDEFTRVIELEHFAR